MGSAARRRCSGSCLSALTRRLGALCVRSVWTLFIPKAEVRSINSVGCRRLAQSRHWTGRGRTTAFEKRTFQTQNLDSSSFDHVAKKERIKLAGPACPNIEIPLIPLNKTAPLPAEFPSVSMVQTDCGDCRGILFCEGINGIALRVKRSGLASHGVMRARRTKPARSIRMHQRWT